MRRLTDDLVLSLKDQFRTLRYSLRSEAEVPGSALPEAYKKVDFGPLGTVGAMIGTPVIRMADGLFSQVETVTQGLLERPEDRIVAFPRPIGDYFARGGGEAKAQFTRVFYNEVKSLLAHYGARHALVSEHAVEDLRAQLLARHGDLIWPALSRRARASVDRDAALVRFCAAFAAGFARVRPIQKLDLIEAASSRRHLMLGPNLYCGLVLGLATAIATVRPGADDADDGEVVESADAVVDARFDRFRTAARTADPVSALAREFESVLPYLP